MTPRSLPPFLQRSYLPFPARKRRDRRLCALTVILYGLAGVGGVYLLGVVIDMALTLASMLGGDQ